MHHVPLSPITFIATCPPLTATLRVRLPLLGARGSGIAHGHFVIFTRLNSLAVLHMVNRLQHLTPPDHHQLAQVGHNRQLAQVDHNHQLNTNWSKSLASCSTSWSQSLASYSTSWSQSPVNTGGHNRQLVQAGHNHQLNTSWSQSPVSTSWSESPVSTSWSQSPVSTSWSQSPVKHKLVTVSRQL